MNNSQALNNLAALSGDQLAALAQTFVTKVCAATTQCGITRSQNALNKVSAHVSRRGCVLRTLGDGSIAFGRIEDFHPIKVVRKG